MGTLKYQGITAGALVRGQIKRLFRDAELQGCTVTYSEYKGLIETTFTNVQIEGPDAIIMRIHRIISDATGRLV